MSTALINRLNQMKQYYQEALKDPLSNRLYIEDLEISIAAFEKQVQLTKPIIQQRWGSE